LKCYVALGQQAFTVDKYSIVPIRSEDRHDIMKWRNEQMYHLRQSEPLTEEAQNAYFSTTVESLFDQVQPKQLLFSFLKGKKCVGYGGLVHINWIDNNAEISFIMQTEYEKRHFQEFWSIFLSLIEKVAYTELRLHKLFVYAFDLRPHLYSVLSLNTYTLDAVLTDHCFFNGKYIDVIIYSKIFDS